MNIIDAAHRTVHDYPGGSEALGPRLGMSAAVLRNKVNPHNNTHHLTLSEAMRMMALTGDHGILRAQARELGYTLQPVAETTAVGGLVQSMLQHVAADGDFARALQSALADGTITANEMRTLASAGDEVQATLFEVLRKMQARVRPAPDLRRVG